jgi:6-phosphogluconolactonase
MARKTSVATGAGPRHLTFNRAGSMGYLINELDGTVAVLSRDTASGVLTPRQTVAAIEGHPEGKAAAADIHLRPDGRFLYASVRRDSTIAGFRVAEADGTLTLVERVTVEKTPRAFEIDPRGRFLVCAGRDDAAIGVYAIDEASGRLTRLERIEVGPNPNWVEIIDLP